MYLFNFWDKIDKVRLSRRFKLIKKDTYKAEIIIIISLTLHKSNNYVISLTVIVLFNKTNKTYPNPPGSLNFVELFFCWTSSSLGKVALSCFLIGMNLIFDLQRFEVEISDGEI